MVKRIIETRYVKAQNSLEGSRAGEKEQSGVSWSRESGGWKTLWTSHEA